MTARCVGRFFGSNRRFSGVEGRSTTAGLLPTYPEYPQSIDRLAIINRSSWYRSGLPVRDCFAPTRGPVSIPSGLSPFCGGSGYGVYSGRSPLLFSLEVGSIILTADRHDRTLGSSRHVVFERCRSAYFPCLGSPRPSDRLSRVPDGHRPTDFTPDDSQALPSQPPHAGAAGKKIAGLMRRFTFLCRLDDQRNELQSLRDDFVTLESGQQVPASDIPHWRREFYTDMAAMMVLDQQLFADTDVSG